MITSERVGRYIMLRTGKPLVSNALDHELSVKDPDAYMKKRNTPALKSWDGRQHFVLSDPDDPTKVFVPFGLKHRLKRWLDEQELDHEPLPPDSANPVPYRELVDGITLDEVQVDACKTVLSHDFCSIELRTGSGKTELFCNAIACLLDDNPDLKIAVMVPLITLLSQTAKRIKRRIPHLAHEVGLLGDGNRDLDHRIVVCTAATAATPKNVKDPEPIRKWVRELDVLILDEAHHSTACTWSKVIDKAETVQKLWAFSGKLTYTRKEKEIKQWNLEVLFGPPVYSGANFERLCPVKALFYKNEHWRGRFAEAGLTNRLVDGVKVDFKRDKDSPYERGVWRGADRDGEYPSLVLSEEVNTGEEWVWIDEFEGDPDDLPNRIVPDKRKIGVYDANGEKVNNPPSDYTSYYTVRDKALVDFRERNEWAVRIAKIALERHEPFVISTARTRQLYYLCQMLRKEGIAHDRLKGGMTLRQQERVLDKLANGAVAGLVTNAAVISEGIDVPNLIHLIKLDGFQEEQLLEQQKGRVERAAEGKKFGFIHIPQDLQHPILRRNATRMKRYYEKAGLLVSVL